MKEDRPLLKDVSSDFSRTAKVAAKHEVTTHALDRMSPEDRAHYIEQVEEVNLKQCLFAVSPDCHNCKHLKVGGGVNKAVGRDAKHYTTVISCEGQCMTLQANPVLIGTPTGNEMDRITNQLIPRPELHQKSGQKPSDTFNWPVAEKGDFNDYQMEPDISATEVSRILKDQEEEEKLDKYEELVGTQFS